MDQTMTLAGTGNTAIWQTAFWLLVVVALILVMGWLAKRFSAFGHLNSQGRMKVLATLPVGNRERVVLVQVGQQCLLLGVAPNKVNTLHVLDSADAVELTQPKHAAVDSATVDNTAVNSAVANSPFQALLQRTLFQDNARNGVQSRANDDAEGVMCDKAR